MNAPVADDRHLARRAWLTYWGAMRRYHRYEVTGFEHLERTAPALLVGYHGRPIAHDLCMLTVTMHERLGYLPHGVIHGYFGENAVLRRAIDDLGFVTGDGDAIAAAVARREHIMVQPGGTREGCRSVRHRYEVDWGERTGYLRLALKHRLPIIPIAGSGVDDGYLGLNDGAALGRRLGVPGRIPVWLGVGPLGLWPFSPPFPVKMRQVIGAPIDLGDVDPDDRDALAALHRRVRGAVQSLLDGANAKRQEASR